MARPPKFVTEQPTATTDDASAPAPADIVPPAAMPQRGYIVDSSGLPAAGMAANRPLSGRSPISTNQADFRVANNLRHREQKFSNLPVETVSSKAIKDATDAAVAKQAAARNRVGPSGKKAWFMLGVEPSERGFNVHVWQYEGDKRVKEIVHRNLSPLAMRERFALHMAALHQKLGF